MVVEHIILALVMILGLSLIALPVSRLLHLPYASILVLLGYLGSEAVIYVGIDTGIRADNFQSIIFYVLIPVLVFESAYNIDKSQLKHNLIVILGLATVVMLLTSLIVAFLLFYGIGHDTGFPWLAALITGAILAATDPFAVVAKMKELDVSNRIVIILEGESLFNDATAIVLFGLFLSIAMADTASSTAELIPVTTVVLEFAFIFFGGMLVGAVSGLSAGLFSRVLHNPVTAPVMTGVIGLLLAYGSYLLAEALCVSGVMSTLLAALTFSVMSERNVEADYTAVEGKYLWDVLSHVASASVFLIVGVVITLEMFEQRWLAMLIAIVSIVLARALSVYSVMFIFGFIKDMKVSLPEQSVMVWGGLRGAVTLALALSLPTSLDYWWTIQSIAFGVVVFSLFFQAPTLSLLVTKLKLER